MHNDAEPFKHLGRLPVVSGTHPDLSSTADRENRNTLPPATDEQSSFAKPCKIISLETGGDPFGLHWRALQPCFISQRSLNVSNWSLAKLCPISGRNTRVQKQCFHSGLLGRLHWFRRFRHQCQPSGFFPQAHNGAESIGSF